MKHIIGTLKRILDTAQDDQAIQANPVVSGRRRTTKRANGKPSFKHHPLTANQVASVFDWISTTRQITVKEDGKTRTYIRQANHIYALAVLFAAHTGVRASELQGLQVKTSLCRTYRAQSAASEWSAPTNARIDSGSKEHLI